MAVSRLTRANTTSDVRQETDRKVRLQKRAPGSEARQGCAQHVGRRRDPKLQSAGYGGQGTRRRSAVRKPLVTKAKKSIAAFKLREGMNDRHESDPARRPDVCIPRQALQHRAAAHPRLSRAQRASRSTVAATITSGLQRADRVSPRSISTGSTRCGAWTSSS